MYYCEQCDNYIDNDYHPCEVDPRDPKGLTLVCPDCFFFLVEDPDGQPDEAQEWHDFDPDC
jgi:hypothetical protein